MDFLRAVHTYVRVVDSGSFAAAASQLGMSRAVATRHVMQLEERLGTRLLNRTTRRLSVTDIGRKYHRFCQRLLDDIQGEEAAIDQLQSGPRGVLKVLSPRSFGSLHMTDAVLAFMKLYPDLQMTLVFNDVALRSRELVDEGFDLAIHLSSQRDSSLMACRIGTVRWATCASPEYLDRFGTPRRPADLAYHNCLIQARSPSSEWRFRNRRAKPLEVTGRFVGSTAIMLRRAALEGLGLARLPTYCVGPDLAEGRLIEVLARFSTPSEPIQAVFPPGRLTEKARGFIDFLAERFRSPPK